MTCDPFRKALVAFLKVIKQVTVSRKILFH
jgi:hypothetical protein